MTGDIHRETGREPHQLREAVEGVVHPLLGTEELVAVALAVEDREEIARELVTGRLKLGVSPERVYELLHAGFPTEGERGASLTAAVGEHAVMEVAPAEIGHVDKRHATGVEAQQEQVAGKRQTGLAGEVELAKSADHLLTDSAFHGLRLGRMSQAEGVLLSDESFVDGFVVKGLQALQVEGDGVRAEAGGSEPCLVLED